ncbi:MAG: hypothetical protein V7L20_10925 [Nostoc sp.]|uniref:hypothetical protein n=1 Tax=Nostoc sp. TaxID=1180 RepID=UPI002FF674A5
MCRISETSPLSMGNAIPLREIYNIAHLITAMSTMAYAYAPPTLQAIVSCEMRLLNTLP